LLPRRSARPRLLRDGAERLMSLRVTYLLEDTAISGLVRTTPAQADALIARGHRVRIATKGLPVGWRASRAEWAYLDDFRRLDTAERGSVIDATAIRAFQIVVAEFFRAL